MKIFLFWILFYLQVYFFFDKVDGMNVDRASHDDVAQAIRDGCKGPPPSEKAEERNEKAPNSEDDSKQVRQWTT